MVASTTRGEGCLRLSVYAVIDSLQVHLPTSLNADAKGKRQCLYVYIYIYMTCKDRARLTLPRMLSSVLYLSSLSFSILEMRLSMENPMFGGGEGGLVEESACVNVYARECMSDRRRVRYVMV